MKQATIDRLSDEIIEILKKKEKCNYAKGKTKREFHSKCSGLLKAYFIVNEDLPRKYKIGLFNQGKIFETLIRFSNSNTKLNSDKFKDIRGMSIKLLGVEGQRYVDSEMNSQDFLL